MLKQPKPENLLERQFDTFDIYSVLFQKGAAHFSASRHNFDTWIAKLDPR